MSIAANANLPKATSTEHFAVRVVGAGPTISTKTT